MNVKDLLNITDGSLIVGNSEFNLDGRDFVKDSREVKEGDIYVALKGEKFDGNDFYLDAINKGAKVCIITKNLTDEELKIVKNKGINIIKVEDTLGALQKFAKFKRNLYNIPVVAITGSVGKTITKDMIASVMKEKYNTLKTEGNYNNEIGVPLTILRLNNEEAMCIEMGMNHFGEIRKLTNIARPTIAVITNIGTAHIGNLGSRENILKAKMEILEGLIGNTVIINNDNDLLNKWAIENKDKYNIITYGIKNNSKFMAKSIKSYENKSEFYINNQKIIVPVGGEHFVLNSLCAIAVGNELNIPMDKIAEGIKNLDLSKKRMEIIKNEIGTTIINDTYNANYDSMKAAIEYLKEIKNKRKIAVLGDMLELGSYSEKLHKDVGLLVDKNIDILITVGKESKYIAEKSNAKEIYEFDSNNQAIEKLKSIITKDDVILLKASNSMNFNEITNSIK